VPPPPEGRGARGPKKKVEKNSQKKKDPKEGLRPRREKRVEKAWGKISPLSNAPHTQKQSVGLHGLQRCPGKDAPLRIVTERLRDPVGMVVDRRREQLRDTRQKKCYVGNRQIPNFILSLLVVFEFSAFSVFSLLKMIPMRSPI